MSETNRSYAASIEHDDMMAEHARLMKDLGWSKERADERVWGYVPPEIKAEREAKKAAEQKRSAKYATVANALHRSDYNELTRERLGQIEDAQAERRRQEMGGH